MVPVINYKHKIYKVKIYKQILGNMHKGQVPVTQLQQILFFQRYSLKSNFPQVGTLLLLTFFPPIESGGQVFAGTLGRR